MPAPHVASPPPRPLMAWDGDCRFCGTWIRRWRGVTGEAVDYITYQEVGGRFPELSAADYAREIHLILPDGRVVRGAEAAFTALSAAPGHGWGLALYKKVPGMAWASEMFYRRVARNRQILSLLTRLFWGDPGTPSTYRFSGTLFVRLVGLVFLVAFLSFWAQSAGLVGENGIWPLKNYYNAISLVPGAGQWDRFWFAPSLLWLAPNDTGLTTLLATGTACSVLAMIGLAPAWALLGCVLTYGSLRGGVPVFLNFQWDALLTESGLIALLVAPWGLWQRLLAPREPSKIGRWLAWWLLFKLMFLSGLVKVITNASPNGPEHPGLLRRAISAITNVPIGENRWLDGTALQYHYFTQPIPASTSWWFHHLPPGFQSTSLWTCMLIEMAVPFAFFGPRRLRHFAVLLQVFLQVVMLVSGNYGFFNLLTLVLCVPLLDDTFWPRRVQRLLAPDMESTAPAASKIRRMCARSGAVLRGAVAGFVLLVGLIQIWQAWEARSRATPPPKREANFTDIISGRMQQLGLVNSYGLFRVMTTDRPELIIEGSDDGVTWKPYEFVWKPGDPLREPGFSTPHMPRLDWQMWFAALEIYYNHSVPLWFQMFLSHLQHGNPAVLSLLDHNPFPNGPPKQLRVQVYLYHFTSEEEHARTGAWWTRTLVKQPG